TINPAGLNRLNHVIYVIGRMKPGVTVAQAQTEMDAISARLGQTFPEIKNWGIRLVTFYRWIVGDTLRTSLGVLLGGVASVLLIACANVANLLLSRAVAREPEMALRSVMGASRSRLLQQLFVESLLVSCIGGLAGLVVAEWAVHLVNVGLPQG